MSTIAKRNSVKAEVRWYARHEGRARGYPEVIGPRENAAGAPRGGNNDDSEVLHDHDEAPAVQVQRATPSAPALPHYHGYVDVYFCQVTFFSTTVQDDLHILYGNRLARPTIVCAMRNGRVSNGLSAGLNLAA